MQWDLYYSANDSTTDNSIVVGYLCSNRNLLEVIQLGDMKSDTPLYIIIKNFTYLLFKFKKVVHIFKRVCNSSTFN